MTRTFPLSLRPTNSAGREPAAWFIPGALPESWLAELAEWRVPFADLRLYVVPTSAADRRPIGLLVTGAGGSPLRVPHPLRARPYVRLADRLFIPADAAPDPPVSDEELRATLKWPVCVLHPSAGLAGFGEDDALRVHALFAPPPRREADWDRVVPGPPPPPRLVSVEPDLPPVSIRLLLDQGRDDIGSEAPGEPAEPPEPGTIQDAFAKATRPGIKAISWLTHHAPGGAQQPTWVDHLRDWADSKLRGVQASLAAARRKELERLRDTLKNDPDKGLRLALPLTGQGRTRGTAPPGATLTPNDVNFNLSRLGGGGPGDAWDVPWEIRKQLLDAYREAANRELALGRFRRAAYVFAELLGDLASAANALKQGRHYREAALLYRERLNNPLAAAECLEHGGLLTEAAAQYEELRLFEKAAALFERLERPDESRRCYGDAVDKAVAAHDWLHAAKLLETKLDAADSALGLLDAQWPASEAAAACLRDWFDLLGRLGRHEQALRRLAALRDDPQRPAAAAQVIGAVAAAYPDAATRVAAADAARVIVGRRLPAAPAQSERRILLDVVAHLAPHDRLLHRDATRYLSHHAPRRPPAPPPPTPGKGPFLMHQFRLPEHVEWKSFSSAGGYFFGHGEVPSGELFLVRGRWDGMVQGVYWPRQRGAAEHIVQPSPDGRTLLVIPLGDLAEPRAVTFPITDSFPQPTAAITPPALPQGMIGACVDDAGTLWVATRSAAGYTLSARDADGRLLSTRSIDPGPGAPPPLRMAAGNGRVFVAAGRVLWGVGPSDVARQELPSPARHLALSDTSAGPRLAVGMEEGVVVFPADGSRQSVGEAMAEPVVAFTRGGMLVAVSRGIGRTYRFENESARLHSAFTSPVDDRPPAGVTPTDMFNHFAVFRADGVVKVFQLKGDGR